MVNSCDAGNCANKSSLSSDISLHTIPYKRPKAKRRQKIWVDFIEAKRVFEPSSASTLCSAHFRQEDFQRDLAVCRIRKNANFSMLKRGEIGICVFPTNRYRSSFIAFRVFYLVSRYKFLSQSSD